MFAKFRSLLIVAALATAVAALVLSACQSYEAEVVTPVAIKTVNRQEIIRGHFENPKVMLVVDRSGSMAEAVSSGAGCTDVRGDYLASSPNDCKWKNLREAFGGTQGFLRTTVGQAHYGLTVFPGGGSACTVGTTEVPISDTSDNALAIADQLNTTITPGGGTPTAPTLDAVLAGGQLATASQNQARLVMLLTDGKPNCNPANQSICVACKQGCTGSTTCNDCSKAPCSMSFTIAGNTDCATENGCLDGDHTVEAVQALAAQDIRTFVIGFGQDTNQDPAKSILNRAAVAGGLARSGATQFYQANSLADLKAALATFVSGNITPCKWTLDPAPTSTQLLEVVRIDSANNSAEERFVNGQDYHMEGNMVVLESTPCAEVQTAAPNRFTFEFRYITSL